MRLCLIGAPIATEYLDPKVARHKTITEVASDPPIGILMLAAVARELGFVPEVIDLNRLYYEFLDGNGRAEEFCSYAAERVPAADIVGLSTMCSSYPFTIRLAKKLKAAHPDGTIVLGGPQASVVDVSTLEAFPFIDLIVRGEAEGVFGEFLRRAAAGASPEELPGITFRRGGQVVRGPAALPIADLDALPMPAFDLLAHYRPNRVVPLELGRGCPFACNFCSTNDFFRRRFRLKSPGKVIEEMRFCHDRYGISHFELIHDMFTVDRRRVLAFCDAMEAAGDGYTWTCSARTDCVDAELLLRMRRAGCASIFFGIETGSRRMQKIIDKELDIPTAMSVIEQCDSLGIQATASLITGFPEEEAEDLRASVAFLMDAIRLDGVEPQFHILAPLAKTPVHLKYAHELLLDGVSSDMAHKGWPQHPEDLELIAGHRETFPDFYALPGHLDRRFLQELREFIIQGWGRCRWLLVALHQDSGDLTEVFRAWREWRDAGRLESGLKYYYASMSFFYDILRFTEQRFIAEMNPQAKCAPAIAAYYRELYRAAEDLPETGSQHEPPASTGEACPFIPEDVCLFELDWDLCGVIQAMRRKEAPDLGTQTRTRRQFAVTDSAGLREITPLAGQLLKFADGSATLSEIAASIADSQDAMDRKVIEDACRARYDELRGEGLIRLVAPRPTPAVLAL